MTRYTSLLAALGFVAAMCVAAPARAEEIQWLKSIEQARQIAGQTNRLVLVHFWSTSCQPCMKLEREVFARPGTAERLQARFVPVKINTDQFAAVAQQYGVTSWPTDVILTPAGQVVVTLQCPQEQMAYLSGLDRAAMTAAPKVVQAYAGINIPPANMPAANMPPANLPSGYGPPPGAPAGNGQCFIPGPASGAPVAMQCSPNGPAPGMASPAPGPVASGYTADRYSNFYGDRPGNPNMPGAPPQQVAPPASQPWAPNQVAPVSAVTDFRSAAATMPGPPAGQQPSRGLTPGADAPLALEGFCPVELAEHEKWVRGDVRFGAVHRGRTYLFSGADQQRRFLANPDFYGPAMSGLDPVLAAESGQSVPGHRGHGLFYGKRIYLFSSEATLAQFCRDPRRYVDVCRTAENGGANLPLR
ncbi:MAG: DUF255 domain-containing protein [Planctomycetia bacterium]|nr:DUF255 domain-containing protein [Planctomycetia bacterium]